MTSLLERAKNLLLENWNGEYTIPGPGLYPHHWGWDTPVVASAYSCFDMEKGMQEFSHLINAQWDNGMIPHIVFEPDADGYFPAGDFYQVHRSDDAPEGIETSGLIQPPTQAIGLYYLYRNCENHEDAEEFVRRMFPKIMDFHRYLMEYRDPEDSGAITILHPWECMDDLPVWDDALERMDTSEAPDYERKDLQHIGDPSERPPDSFYDCFIYLIDRMRKKDYDFKEIYPDHPFKFKDVVNTSILYMANNCLLEIAEDFDFDTEEIEEWQDLISSNFNDNFKPSPDSRMYYSYDLVAEEFAEVPTVASLLPLFSGMLSPGEAEPLIEVVGDFQFCAGKCIKPMIPTTSFNHSSFSPDTYWRGPVWAITTWLIYAGLRHYGKDESAEMIRDGFLELVEEHGFREYYSPTTGEGKGIDKFTWTASVVIDMLEEKVELPTDFSMEED